MSTPLRVGIIGASVRRGWGLNAHIPAIRELPDLTLQAVCTAHPETARESAETFGAPLAFSDYRELVEHPDIDLVTIAVRVPWHHEMVLAAVAAGKHVYCEWPLAFNAEQGADMHDAATVRGVANMVGLQGRAAPWVRFLRDFLDAGELGDVYHVHTTTFIAHPYMRPDTLWAAQRESNNNILSIQTGHMLDMLEAGLGPLVEITPSMGTRLRHWKIGDGDAEPVSVDAPDHISLAGRFRNGGVLSMTCGYVPFHGAGWRFEIYAEKGAIRATTRGPGHVAEGPLEIARAGEEWQPLSVPASYSLVPDSVPRGPSYHVAHLYQRFADAILLGAPLAPSFEDGVARLTLLHDLAVASEQGTRVSLEST